MIEAAEEHQELTALETPETTPKKPHLSKSARLTLNIISGIAIATSARLAWAFSGMEGRYDQLSQLQSPQHRDFPALNDTQRKFLENIAENINKALGAHYAAEASALQKAKTYEERGKIKDVFEKGRLAFYRNAYDQVVKAMPGMHLHHNPPCTQLGLNNYPEDCVLKYFRELLAQADLYPHIIRREQGPTDYRYAYNTLSVNRVVKNSTMDIQKVLADFESAFPSLASVVEDMAQVAVKELHALSAAPQETADSEQFNVMYAHTKETAVTYPDTLSEREKQWAIYHTLGHTISRKFFRENVLIWNEANQRDASAPSANQLCEAFANIFAVYTLSKKYPQEKQFFLQYLQERGAHNNDYALSKELIFAQAHIVGLKHLVASKAYFPLFSESPNVHDRASLQEYIRTQTELLHNEVEVYEAIWENYNSLDPNDYGSMDRAIAMTKKQYPSSLLLANDKGWRGWDVFYSSPLMRKFHQIGDEHTSEYTYYIKAELDPMKLVESHASLQNINLAGAADAYAKILYDNIHPLEEREHADLAFVMRDGKTNVTSGDYLRYVLGTSK